MSSHWYDKDGKLFEVDLKEARKLKLAPSVTTIIHEFSNSYGLELYKARQVFMASLTLPRPFDISDEEYFKLVKEDSEQHSEKAKEFGSTLHYIISNYLNNKLSGKFDKFIKKQAWKVLLWIANNKDSVIVDFKTQETKEGEFKQPYDDWLFQLCGYRINSVFMEAGEYIEHSFCNTSFNYGGQIDYARLIGSLRDKTKLINIMISSNEDIPINIYEWKPAKVDWGREVFIKMTKLFHVIKRL